MEPPRRQERQVHFHHKDTKAQRKPKRIHRLHRLAQIRFRKHGYHGSMPHYLRKKSCQSSLILFIQSKKPSLSLLALLASWRFHPFVLIRVIRGFRLYGLGPGAGDADDAAVAGLVYGPNAEDKVV